MKKVLALILALVLVLSLAACGGGSSSEETKAEITTDSLIGDWYRTDDYETFDNGKAKDLIEVEIRLLKGGIYKSSLAANPNWDEFGTNDWEIKDGCVILTEHYSTRDFNYAYEIIDENTIKRVDTDTVYNKK